MIAGAPHENTPVAQTSHFAMGTVMAHKAYGARAEDCLATICRELSYIESVLSRFLPDSDIRRVNGSAGIQSEKVSVETYAVLSKAVEYSRRFPGCFDATVEPLVTLWHAAREASAEPDADSIGQALALVDYRDVLLDPWKMTAGLRNLGQGIDLGGIGKGFAGNKILEVYKEFEIASAYSNLGGNVLAVGAKPGGEPWQIGIQHPREENRIIGAVSVIDESVVTSGDYQRCYFDARGIRRHHILDPKTGYPSYSGLASVTIVSGDCIAADALSTIVFIAGMEKGLEFLSSVPGAGAILVDGELRVFVTEGLRHRFQAEKGIDVAILN